MLLIFALNVIGKLCNFGFLIICDVPLDLKYSILSSKLNKIFIIIYSRKKIFFLKYSFFYFLLILSFSYFSIFSFIIRNNINNHNT